MLKESIKIIQDHAIKDWTHKIIAAISENNNYDDVAKNQNSVFPTKAIVQKSIKMMEFWP